jgi:hypothetical protein
VASAAKLAPEYTPPARVPPLTVPNWNEIVVEAVGAPIVDMVLACAAEDSYCDFASVLTVMSYEPLVASNEVEADNTVGSDAVAFWAVNSDGELSALTALWNEDSEPLTLP